MKTKAHALVQRRYVDRGKTTRIVVLPAPGTGLPAGLLEGGRPVPLDLLAGRPVNLHLDDEGMSVDLCFDGPPTRCTLPWATVVAVQSEESEELVQTLAVTVAVRMEDDSLRPVGTAEDAQPFEPEEPAPKTPSGPPVLRVLDGGE